MAYEQLSPAYKEFLDGLTVVNTSAKVRVSDTRKHRVAEQDEPAAPKNSSPNILPSASIRKPGERRFL